LAWLNLDPQTRSEYLKELEQRAGTQADLAVQQAQELDQLKQLQQSADKSHLAQIDELKRQQALTEKEILNRERLIAQQQQDSLQRIDTVRQQAQLLDRDNRDLNARLAQSSQRVQVLEDQVDLLQQRLEETTVQLADARRSTQRASERLAAIQANSRGRGPATITANNSVLDRLTAVTVPGVDIRQDFDQVRIALPADELFVPGTATLREGADTVLGQAADVLLKYYPQQIIGVEAHTDGTLAPGTLWRNEHQMSAAQAMTVFEQLTQRFRLDPRQLFVIGHGSNHPRQQTPAAGFEAINRRVELVVYPERFGQR
jgi:flagellar motor protein MotB